jgi:catechol 2,3-dioxygenase-like lactoylglutathione lyase family enzyme
MGHAWFEESTMITGGNATVFVSNMDQAVRFYTEVLGLRLTNRFGDHWATVEAGKGLTIGLHPASAKHPSPGTKGGMMLGLEVGISIENAVNRLTARGVRVGGIIRASEGNFVDLEDPDGNPIYLWEVSQAVPASDLVHSAAN